MDIVRCLNTKLRFHSVASHGGQWLFTELHRLFILLQCDTQIPRTRTPDMAYVYSDTEKDTMTI